MLKKASLICFQTRKYVQTPACSINSGSVHTTEIEIVRNTNFSEVSVCILSYEIYLQRNKGIHRDGDYVFH